MELVTKYNVSFNVDTTDLYHIKKVGTKNFKICYIEEISVESGDVQKSGGISKRRKKQFV